MAAKKGLLLLLKRGNADSPQTFTAFAGQRATSLQINQEQVDITSKTHTDRWRRLLNRAGVRSVSASGAGVFEDDAAAASAVTDLTGSPGAVQGNYQLIVPGLGTFEGAFEIGSLEFAGDHAGEVTWSFTVESAGAVGFNAAA